MRGGGSGSGSTERSSALHHGSALAPIVKAVPLQSAARVPETMEGEPGLIALDKNEQGEQEK